MAQGERVLGCWNALKGLPWRLVTGGAMRLWLWPLVASIYYGTIRDMENQQGNYNDTVQEEWTDTLMDSLVWSLAYTAQLGRHGTYHHHHLLWRARILPDYLSTPPAHPPAHLPLTRFLAVQVKIHSGVWSKRVQKMNKI